MRKILDTTHNDHLGSTVAVTDEAGQTVWASEYTPFGGKHSTEGELAHAAKFTGKDLDENIGLYYFNARWYDQEIGRFISQDQFQDGLNWYSYCNNNPLIFIDPSGNLSQDANGNWQLDHWDMQFENGAFNYWRNDWFFTGEWWKDSAKLDSATAFLKYFDFEWKQNWVRGAFDGGKMRNDYTAADRYRVQTIQAIMGIDVTGFYDAKTYFAAGQLQMMYNIPNSKSGVFGTNTLLAAEALWSKDWKFEEFYMGIFDQQVFHFAVDTTLDLAVNAAIFSGGKAVLTKLLQGAETTAIGSIGRVAVPEGVAPGTTKFGNIMHERIGEWLKAQYPDTEFYLSIRPGQTGIDVRYLNGPKPSWTFLEIKPRTTSGLNAFNKQIANWGLPTSKTAVLTYDYDGYLFWGW